MGENKIDLAARAAELHQQLAGIRDDRRRAENRKDELEREVAEAQQRLEITLESLQRFDEKEAAAQEELESITALTGTPKVREAPKPTPRPTTTSDESKAREGILRLKVFTVAELAGFLHVTKRECEEHLAREEAAGVVAPTGEKFGGSPVWEYVPPTDPGEAFKTQQAAREHEQAEEVLYADPVEGTGSRYLTALPKDVRKEARKALRDGWVLLPGGDHYLMTKGEHTISVSATPSSPSAEARSLRRRLNGVGMSNVQRRGETVAGTGKPIGSSGKPGLDRARANAGKTVRRKGRKGM